MAEINEYFKNKYETEDTEDYRKKLARHRRLIAYRVLAGILFVAVILAGIYYNYRTKVYSDYSVLRSINYSEVSTADYRKFNNNIVRYSTDGAFAFNISNDLLWNQTYEMQNPMISICRDHVAIGDYKGTRIYVMDSKGKQGEIDTTLPIHNFCVSDTGSVAVVLEENDITWIRLFSVNGELIASDRTTMSQSGYPVDIALSPNGSILAVSYLMIDQGNLTTSVAYYNFGDVGQNEIDNLVSGYNYKDTVISYINFINDKTAYAVGDDKFVVYKGSQKPESIFELDIKEEKVKSVFNSENYIGLVFIEGTSEAAYRIDVYNTEGELRYSKKFNLEYTDIVLSGDMVVIYNSSECLMYDLNDKEKYNGNFKSSVIEVVPTASSTRYLLVSGNKTEEIQLK
ncbi:MAG: DUF5711 family protein [Lachnospiraceae bacterium]|nr:DUF5711 family protein [Lachnospiraceae bacterium]